VMGNGVDAALIMATARTFYTSTPLNVAIQHR